ncbi:hypothetical protein [Actinomadura yumaensis]|uniref:Esterase n=1 Tax=Actinomadura yumaensis TaxID=111807 RepID=A0ABW2CTV0_9ACTN
MEPTSAGLLGLVCVLAAAAFGAAVVLWPRAAGSGLRPIAARSGLLLTCQVLLTAAIVLVANRYFVFYATWNDLLGGTNVKVQVKQVQPSLGKEADPSGLVHRNGTDLAPVRRGRAHDPAKDGRVDHLRLRGARSGLDAEAYVYLPPQYFQPAYAKKRLPVVLLLSGGRSDGKLTWIKDANVPAAAAEAVRTGRAQPAVYGMVRSVRGLTPSPHPPAGSLAGQGLPKGGTTGIRPSACLDLPGQGGGQAETFYAQDLPTALAQTYRLPRARGGWAAAGFGTSGQCALRLAMLHSDRFAVGASVAGRLTGPPTTPESNAPRPDLYGGSKVFEQDNDLHWRLEHLPPPPVSVLLADGSAGGRAEAAERFRGLVKPPMRAETFLKPAAPATLKEWRPMVPHVLEWLSARLRGE